MKSSFLLSVHRITAALAAVFLIVIGSSAPAKNPPADPTAIAVALVDDFTGGEAQGALDANTASQLLGLLGITGIESVQINYFLVQETVTDPVTITLPGFQSPPIPNLPSDALPAEKYQREMRKYVAAVKAAQKARQEWQTKTAANLENYLKDCVSAQGALAERWAAELKVRRGMADFRRSSVAATIIAAAQSMPASAKQAYLLIATDGIDEPPGKRDRKTPFTEIELPPRIHLIYVNTAGRIPRSPLFKGLKNNSTAVADLASAVACIAKTVIEPESEISLVKK